MEATTLAATDRLHKVEQVLLGTEKFLLTVLVVGMTLLAFLQIVLRKVFSGGFLWADTFLRHMVLWLAFLGAGVAAAHDKHFGADVGERFLSGRTKTITSVGIHLFTTVVCAFLTRAAIIFMGDELESAPALFLIGTHRVSSSLFEIILPIGFGLLLIHYLLRLITAVLELRK